MSLPTGQQRVLESIEGKLAESDPRLVSLFSIFTRLTPNSFCTRLLAAELMACPRKVSTAVLSPWFDWLL